MSFFYAGFSDELTKLAGPGSTPNTGAGSGAWRGKPQEISTKPSPGIKRMDFDVAAKQWDQAQTRERNRKALREKGGSGFESSGNRPWLTPPPPPAPEPKPVRKGKGKATPASVPKPGRTNEIARPLNAAPADSPSVIIHRNPKAPSTENSYMTEGVSPDVAKRMRPHQQNTESAPTTAPVAKPLDQTLKTQKPNKYGWKSGVH